MNNEKRKYPAAKVLIILVVLAAAAAVIYLASGDRLKQSGTELPSDESQENTKITPTNPPEQHISIKTIEDIEKQIAAMTLEEKVYQLFFVTHDSLVNVTAVTSGDATRSALQKYPVGGLVYFTGNIESSTQVTAMIAGAQSFSKIPMFIGVDEEGGRVSRLKNAGVTSFSPMGQLTTAEEAANVGDTLGRELLTLGFNVDFAPVADVLVNSHNTEIGDRSFGSDPVHDAQMVESFTKAIQAQKVSATLKHFPGHASTTVNSHTGYSESTRTLDQLKKCEFLPFKAGIDAGADFVMVSHMTLVNATKEKLPCSLSKEVITDWLKGELGFKGVVVTDAMNMGAITENYSPGQAAVMALQAGADMLLMSSSLKDSYNAVMKAVSDGTLSEARIDASVRRILTVKYNKGMLN